MSAPVTAANSARSGGLLQRMPFGRFKGLPFAQVPEEYAAWLLKRDIDDRLRAALKGSNGSGQAASVGNRAAQPAQAGHINRVVSEFLQARREAADARRRVEKVRGRLIPLLDRNNGHWTDRASNQRVAIEEQSRWEYDASALHRLVDSGLLAEEQFAECLRTVVDKNVVASWIEQAGSSQRGAGERTGRKDSNARAPHDPCQAAERLWSKLRHLGAILRRLFPQ